MARTHKSQVSDFIKDMLFGGAELTQVKDAPMKKKLTKIIGESNQWRTAIVTEENIKSIRNSISVPDIKLGDTVSFNNTAINVKKHNSSNGCTIVASVKRGKLISVTHAKEDRQVLFCL